MYTIVEDGSEHMNFTYGSGSLRAPRSRFNRRRRRLWTLESLEGRALLTAISLDSLVAQPVVAAAPFASTGVPAGMSPSQVRAAYGFDKITFDGNVVGDGSGQTIAIVDAYYSPTVLADLQTFNAAYGIADPPSLTQYVAEGTPMADASWSIETALDVQWAHAIAPGANILLVSAKSNSMADLFSAVDYARQQTGVVAVSMSWGSTEFYGQTAYDSLFTTPAGHVGGDGLAGGVTFVAASGDGGAWDGAIYPSSSPNVLAVGGTTLTTSATGTYVSETGWSGSGGGVSFFEKAATYQRSVQRGATQTTPDVSINANPSTGYSVYSSSAGGWITVGGTSAGAPQWAALAAIVDQGLALKGVGAIGGNLISTLYTLPKANFHDVVSGSNGYDAHTGYDLVTGLGTPRANKIVAAIVGSAVAAPTTTTSTVLLAAPAGTVQPSYVISSPGASNDSGSTSLDSSNAVVILVPTATDIVIAMSQAQAWNAAQSALAGDGIASSIAEMATAGALSNIALPPSQLAGPTGFGQGLTNPVVSVGGARSELAPTDLPDHGTEPANPDLAPPSSEAMPEDEVLPDGAGTPAGDGGAQEAPLPVAPPAPARPNADEEEDQADPKMSFAAALLAASAFYGTQTRFADQSMAGSHPGGPRRLDSAKEMEDRQKR
jgi:hypothetical protein